VGARWTLQNWTLADWNADDEMNDSTVVIIA